MGGIGKAVGGLLGGGGKNNFKAEKAKLDEAQYGPGVADALAQTRARMAANATAGAGMDEFAAALKAQMAGQGPSLAQQQLQTAAQQNASQAAAALAGAKGISPALATRMIAQNQAGANQAAAGQAASTRLAEQLSTEQLLAQALQGQRAADIQQQQANTATLNTVGGLQQGQNQARIQNVSQANQANSQVAAQNAESGGKLLGGLLGAAGTVLGGPLGGALGSAVGGALGKYDGGEIDFRSGGTVPGRARVHGDSPTNDTVPAMLSPGEIVVPRTVAQAEDAPDRAAEFVRAIKAKKAPTGYGKVLQAQREIDARLARLEKMADGGEVEEPEEDEDATEEEENDERKRKMNTAVGMTTGLLNRARVAAQKRNDALEAAYMAAAE